MRADYRKWLEEQKYSSGTISSQLHRAGRIEDCYGNLEQLSQSSRLPEILGELSFTTEDERRGKPNPSRIPFEGNIRNNLASYKAALVRYMRFLDGGGADEGESVKTVESLVQSKTTVNGRSEADSQKLSLERDMQAALRLDIKNLGATLSIIDDGAERSVESGLIDIMCEDSGENSLVVVELKAGKTDSRAIGQILGYMGDIAQEEPERTVRGILVAQDFDQRTVSASRAVPNLSLMKYAIAFKFERMK